MPCTCVSQKRDLTELYISVLYSCQPGCSVPKRKTPSALPWRISPSRAGTLSRSVKPYHHRPHHRCDCFTGYSDLWCNSMIEVGVISSASSNQTSPQAVLILYPLGSNTLRPVCLIRSCLKDTVRALAHEADLKEPTQQRLSDALSTVEMHTERNSLTFWDIHLFSFSPTDEIVDTARVLNM